VQQTESATRSGAAGRKDGRVQAFECAAFEYASSPVPASEPVWEAWGPTAVKEKTPEAAPQPTPPDPVGAAREAELRAEQERRLAEGTRRAFEAGRERGREEGRQGERGAQVAAQAEAEKVRLRQAAALIENFRQERERFLEAAEHEVVELALAVAARILRREAQMDPLLLTGAVRVALGQLAGSTEVRLRVPPAEFDLWTEAMALVPNLAVKPTVLAGEGMRLGDCVVETRMGSVDLGIRAQMAEIERGFFDRAGGTRSGSSSSEPSPETGRQGSPVEERQ
jgi:flagellar assembly protein FliH